MIAYIGFTQILSKIQKEKKQICLKLNCKKILLKIIYFISIFLSIITFFFCLFIYLFIFICIYFFLWFWTYIFQNLEKNGETNILQNYIKHFAEKARCFPITSLIRIAFIPRHTRRVNNCNSISIILIFFPLHTSTT